MHFSSPRTLARRAALRALAQSEKPAFTAPDFADLEARARPFARELFSGVNRHRALLDYQFALALGKKPVSSLDAPVRAALRLAAYEFFQQKHAIHAVGNAYVELIRGEKLSSASAFLNAIIRGFKPALRPFPRQASARLPIEFSHPQWLVQRAIERLGVEEAELLLRANNERAPLCLRVNTRQTTRDTVLAEFAGARAADFAPDAISTEGGFSSIPVHLWEMGALFVQDEAAQVVAHYAAPPEGAFVIDLTGAPGGKATHLAQMVGANGRVLVCDQSEIRLQKVRENAARLRLFNIETLAVDARQMSQGLAAHFNTSGADFRLVADVVLLDVPCLGTGTFRRRPDAKWRKTPEQLAQLVVLQRELLTVAAQLVAPGGALVYSTCSLEPEENLEQAGGFTERLGWQAEAAPEFLAPFYTENGWLQSWPHRHRMDGMFAAKWRKK